MTLSLLALTQLEATATLDDGTEEQTALSALPEAQFPLLIQVLDAEVGPDAFWRTLVDALVLGLDSHTT